MDSDIKKYYSKPKGRYPSFIKTLKGVSGRTRAIKIKKVKKVLSKCRRLGISLTNGKSFKSYKSLVSKCRNKMSNKLKKIKDELAQGNQRISELISERDFLNSELKNCKTTEKPQLLAELDNLKSSFNIEVQNLKKLDLDKANLIKEIADLSSKNVSLSGEVNKLSSTNKDLVQRIDEISANLAQGSQQINDLLAEKEAINLQLQECKNSSTGYTTEKEQLTDELNRIKEQLEIKVQLFTKLESEKNDLINKLSEFDTNNKELSGQLQASIGELADFNSQIKDLNDKLASEQETCRSSLSKSSSECEERIKLMEDEKNRLDDEKNTVLEDLNLKLTNCESNAAETLIKLNECNSGKDYEMKNLQSTLTKELENKRILEEEINTIKTEHSRVIEELNKQIEKLNKQLKKKQKTNYVQTNIEKAGRTPRRNQSSSFGNKSYIWINKCIKYLISIK
jgi:chromosome segregation ATPase